MSRRIHVKESYLGDGIVISGVGGEYVYIPNDEIDEIMEEIKNLRQT